MSLIENLEKCLKELIEQKEKSVKEVEETTAGEDVKRKAISELDINCQSAMIWAERAYAVGYPDPMDLTKLEERDIHYLNEKGFEVLELDIFHLMMHVKEIREIPSKVREGTFKPRFYHP